MGCRLCGHWLGSGLLSQANTLTDRNFEDNLHAMITSHTEAHAELFFPVHDTTHNQIGPLLETSVTAIADHLGQMKDVLYRIYVANLTSLGSNWEKAIHELFRIVSDKLAEHPDRTCAIVVMPNVGTRGELYDETSISKAQGDIKDLFFSCPASNTESERDNA